MHRYRKIIFSLGQLPSCNTPKGTLKSNFHVEYKSVDSDLANDAQNGIFKLYLCHQARYQTAVRAAEAMSFVFLQLLV